MDNTPQVFITILQNFLQDTKRQHHLPDLQTVDLLYFVLILNISWSICAGFSFRKEFHVALTSETKAWHEEPTQESGGILHFWASAENLNSALLPHHILSHAWDTRTLRFSPPPHATNFITAKPRVNHNTALTLDSPQTHWTQPYTQSHRTHNQTEGFMHAQDTLFHLLSEFSESHCKPLWVCKQAIMQEVTS